MSLSTAPVLNWRSDKATIGKDSGMIQNAQTTHYPVTFAAFMPPRPPPRTAPFVVLHTKSFTAYGQVDPTYFSLESGVTLVKNESASSTNNETILNKTTTLLLQNESDHNFSFVLQLFGFPSFCSPEARNTCDSTPLRNCVACDMRPAAVFIVLMAILGSLIIAGNVLVIWFTIKRKQGFTGNNGKIKASLAVADMLTGIQIFFVTMYNLSWTINSTSAEIIGAVETLNSSWQAYFGGMLYILGFSASMNNLIYLGLQRLYAIRWPIHYKHQSSNSLHIGLGMTWFFSLLVPVVPTWFPDVFIFGYSHTIFLYNLTVVHPDQVSALFVMIVVVFVVPFSVMTIITVTTSVYVARYVVRRSKQVERRNEMKSQEIWIFITVVVMQMGFTITLVPVTVVVLLAATRVLAEDVFSYSYLLGFYLSMSNSLVNVIVYSAMDGKFRKAISDLMSICCSFRKNCAHSTAQTPS